MANKEVVELNDYFCYKSTIKQEVYAQTLQSFELIKDAAASVINDFKSIKEEQKHSLDLSYSSIGAYEAEMRFSGDALSIQMHTNVFAFPQDHFVNKLEMVKKDGNTGYVGMILIYNFLADSLRYNRLTDVGYLLGRIFINKNGNYFIHGLRQFSFLFQDFENQLFDQDAARKIVEVAIRQAIDFDLYVPPFDAVKEISLYEKNMQQGNTAIKTGKRLGFEYDARED